MGKFPTVMLEIVYYRSDIEVSIFFMSIADTGFQESLIRTKCSSRNLTSVY
jgi:hypothetical protein